MATSLNKLFVSVPATVVGSGESASYKTASEFIDANKSTLSDSKIYFLAGTQEIIAKGVVYGLNPNDAIKLLDTTTDVTTVSVYDGVVTLSASIAEENGIIKKGSATDIILAKVAYTGSDADVKVSEAISTTNSYVSIAKDVTIHSAISTLSNAIDTARKQVADLDASETVAYAWNDSKAISIFSKLTQTDGKVDMSDTAVDLHFNAAPTAENYIVTKSDIKDLAGALHYISGATVSVAEDGTITVSKADYNPTAGDVVVDSATAKEYIYNGTAWEELGDETAYVLKAQTLSVSATASHGVEAAIGGTQETPTLSVTVTPGSVASGDTSVVTGGAVYSYVGGVVAGLTYNGTAVDGYYVSSVSEANGVVSYTTAALPTLSVKDNSTSYVAVSNHEIEIKTVALSNAVGMSYTTGTGWSYANGTIASDGLVSAADVAKEIADDEKVVAAALNAHESAIEALQELIGDDELGSDEKTLIARIAELESEKDHSVTTLTEATDNSDYLVVGGGLKTGSTNDYEYTVKVTEAVYSSADKGFTTDGLVSSTTLNSVLGDMWETYTASAASV